MDEKNPVLIIEDDSEIAGIVAANLADMGLDTEHVSDGKKGLERALSNKFSLIILDLMLPGMDGISVCTKLREEDALTPVLMLTAKAEELYRVLGLELGADDYITKPFSVRELIARVRALLRRTHANDAASSAPGSGDNGVGDHSTGELKVGELTVDFEKRKVTVRDRMVDLTVKEFELLNLFIRNPGRVYSRSDLLDIIWGYRFEGYEHTVNTHINRLRNKIEDDPAHPEYLKTVWGVGYRFAEQSEFPS